MLIRLGSGQMAEADVLRLLSEAERHNDEEPEKVFGNNPMWLKESSPAILASNVETMILKSFFLYQKAEKSFFYGSLVMCRTHGLLNN